MEITRKNIEVTSFSTNKVMKDLNEDKEFLLENTALNHLFITEAKGFNDLEKYNFLKDNINNISLTDLENLING